MIRSTTSTCRTTYNLSLKSARSFLIMLQQGSETVHLTRGRIFWDKAPYLQVRETPFSPLLVHRFSSLNGLLAILKSTNHFSILDTKRKQFLRCINMHLLLGDAGSGTQYNPINLLSHIPIMILHQTARTLYQCPPKTGLPILTFLFLYFIIEKPERLNYEVNECWFYHYLKVELVWCQPYNNSFQPCIYDRWPIRVCDRLSLHLQSWLYWLPCTRIHSPSSTPKEQTHLSILSQNTPWESDYLGKKHLGILNCT